MAKVDSPNARHRVLGCRCYTFVRCGLLPGQRETEVIHIRIGGRRIRPLQAHDSPSGGRQCLCDTQGRGGIHACRLSIGLQFDHSPFTGCVEAVCDGFHDFVQDPVCYGELGILGDRVLVPNHLLATLPRNLMGTQSQDNNLRALGGDLRSGVEMA